MDNAATDRLIKYYESLLTSTGKDKRAMATKRKADNTKATTPSLNCLQHMPFARAQVIAMNMPERVPVAFDEDGNAILAREVFELVSGFTLEVSETINNAHICIRHMGTDYTFSFTDPVSVAEEIIAELDEEQDTVCEVVSMAMSILHTLMKNA